MDFNFLNQNTEPNKGKKSGPQTRFSGSITGAILIFMLITGLYLLISGSDPKVPEVPISDLAKSVVGGEVKKIIVAGEKLSVTNQNYAFKEFIKKAGLSLSQKFFRTFQKIHDFF